jgi:ABC-type multidrug transport system fused ATPase/permease subunit
VRYNGINKVVYDLAMKLAVWRGVMNSTFETLAFLVVIVITYFGSILYFDGQITLGDITSFMLYLMMLTMNIVGGTSSIQQLLVMVGCAESISDIFDYEPKIDKSKGSIIPT